MYTKQTFFEWDPFSAAYRSSNKKIHCAITESHFNAKYTHVRIHADSKDSIKVDDLLCIVLIPKLYVDISYHVHIVEFYSDLKSMLSLLFSAILVVFNSVNVCTCM